MINSYKWDIECQDKKEQKYKTKQNLLHFFQTLLISPNGFPLITFIINQYTNKLIIRLLINLNIMVDQNCEK